MATNKILLSTSEEFTDSFTPSYTPIYGLLIPAYAKAYSEEVGQHKFTQVEAKGDIRARRLTPKDTTIKQIAVTSGSRIFKKAFYANQYTHSLLQSSEEVNSVTAQVLDEHNKQFDENLFLGEGTSAGTVLNNSLFWSADPNYDLRSNVNIAAPTADTAAYYSTLMGLMEDANKISGQKLIMIYGATAQSRLNSLFPSSTDSLRSVIEGGLDESDRIIRVPSDINLGGAQGIMVVTPEALVVHHCGLPKLDDQGINAEKKYSWHNFLMGTAMVELKRKGAIIRQPLTFL